MSEPAPQEPEALPERPRWGALGWLALLLVGLVELAGQQVTRARVPTDEDWGAVAAHVRGAHRAGDLVTAAPFWADPLVRLHLGDLISQADAGNHDAVGYDRLWVVSLRGHRAPEEPERLADETWRFGQLTVGRWDLGPSPVVHDFTARIAEAEVSVVESGMERACPWRELAPRGGSGLAAGPMQPSGSFVCDARRPWLWVGPTAVEDLELRPRHCIWQHPLGIEPVVVTYRDVPLGTHLVLHGGLYWVHERDLTGGPVRVVVRVDGEVIGEMTHRDGDGFKRLVALTRPQGGPSRGDVSFEVTSPAPRFRSFCWSATSREGARAEER